MPRLSAEDQLIKAQQDKAEAERRLKEARSKISKKARAIDTKRKIIIGAITLKDISELQLPKLRQRLISAIPQKDRHLFPEFFETKISTVDPSSQADQVDEDRSGESDLAEKQQNPAHPAPSQPKSSQ